MRIEPRVPTALSSKGLTVLFSLMLAACTSAPTHSIDGVSEAGRGLAPVTGNDGRVVAGSAGSSNVASAGRSAGAGGSARADAGKGGRGSSGTAGLSGVAGASALAGDGAAEGGMGGSATGESGAGGVGTSGSGAGAGGRGGRGGSGGMSGNKAGAGGAGSGAAGAGRGSSGSGGAGAGGAGDDCSACEHASSENACRTAVTACDQLQGMTDADSPMPNVSKANLCRQLLDCEHMTRCAANQITDCLCGAGVDPVVCYPTQTLEQADGACKTLIAAAAETDMLTEIATRISDVNYAVGAAHAVIESCDYQGCFNQCLQ